MSLTPSELIKQQIDALPSQQKEDVANTLRILLKAVEGPSTKEIAAQIRASKKAAFAAQETRRDKMSAAIRKLKQQEQVKALNESGYVLGFTNQQQGITVYMKKNNSNRQIKIIDGRFSAFDRQQMLQSPTDLIALATYLKTEKE